MGNSSKNYCANFPTDKILLEALINCNPEAQECFYRKARHYVVPFLDTKGKLKEIGNEDIFQNTIVTFFSESIFKIHYDKTPLVAILRKYAEMRWIDAYRKEKNITFEPNVDIPSDDTSPIDVEYAKELAESISELNEEEKSFLKLVYYENLKPKVIAKILGITEGAVSTKKGRLVLKLSKIMTRKTEKSSGK